MSKLVCCLLLLFIAVDSNAGEASVPSELDQLRNSGAESLEQSLVRRGEMTPFGSVVNSSIEVNISVLLVFDDDNNIEVDAAAVAAADAAANDDDDQVCCCCYYYS